MRAPLNLCASVSSPVKWAKAAAFLLTKLQVSQWMLLGLLSQCLHRWLLDKGCGRTTPSTQVAAQGAWVRGASRPAACAPSAAPHLSRTYFKNTAENCVGKRCHANSLAVANHNLECAVQPSDRQFFPPLAWGPLPSCHKTDLLVPNGTQ